MKLSLGAKDRFALAAACTIFLLALAWTAAVALGRSELQRADLRLGAEARSVQAAFETRVAQADSEAGSLATSRRLQQALASRSRARLAELVRGRSIAVYSDGRLLAGSVPAGAVTRGVAVGVGGRSLGRVVAYVPLDPSLVGQLGGEVGIDRKDRLVLVRGPEALATSLGRSGDAQIDGKRYRGYAVELIGPPQRVVLEAATLRSGIASGAHRRVLWIVIAALTTLATIFVAGRALITGRWRRLPMSDVPTDDMRALALVGDALASTHNPERLLPVILHAAMQATGASAGTVMRDGVEVAHEGATGNGADPLRLDLTSDEGPEEQTTLLLYPPGPGFDERTTTLAHSLAAQAAVALENARLHGIVKRQAVTDELTGLANRRAFMETLELELRRADRFGSALALVFADLDDFKRVNDRFGHHVGDQVLSTFAEIVLGRIREIDVAARLGGEEFAVLLPATDLGGAEALAESLRSAVGSLAVRTASAETVGVTASFGVAAFPETHSADELMTAADLALYTAKRQGKNRVVAGSRDAA